MITHAVSSVFVWALKAMILNELLFPLYKKKLVKKNNNTLALGAQGKHYRGGGIES
jgi:hypothetical protein